MLVTYGRRCGLARWAAGRTAEDAALEQLQRVRREDPALHALMAAALAAPAAGDAAGLARDLEPLASAAERAQQALAAGGEGHAGADRAEAVRAAAEYVRSRANCAYGTAGEAGARAQMAHVTKTDRFHKRRVLAHRGVEVYVGGRCDGLATDPETQQTTVVEIKTRVGRLFGRVPEYERLQVLAYLFVHGLEGGLLVEQHAGRSLQHYLRWDAAYWAEAVEAGARRFVDDLLGDTPRADGR
jgi:hypothetical protein